MTADPAPRPTPTEGRPAATGLFVTFEGGDGVGKTTQAALLEEWLTDAGRTVVRTREPGGTEVGVLIRDIVLHHRGEVVIQDRYLDSSVAYQGAGRVLGRDEVRDLSLWATEGLLPDVTVLLDLDPATARARLDADDKPFDRLEAEKEHFHARVRAEFLSLADAEPGRFLVLDASRPADELAAAVRERVQTLLR